jgi:RNA 2',3'-cyclic 3'-phosphodiesterase
LRFRVFAALELPRENQERLGDVLAGLQAAAPAGAVRWVRPEAIHLTVKFYGGVAGETLPDVEAVLAEAARGARPMRLRMQGLGVFPNARRPQVVWAGLAGEVEALAQLQNDLEARSAALGFAPEGRPFKPHLTLGRVNGSLQPGDHLRLMESLKARRDENFGEFTVEALHLIRSDLRPAGSVYTTLYTAALGQPGLDQDGPQPQRANISIDKGDG